MADIAIFRINYKSDFVLTINSDAGWAVPFCIKFWTSMPSQGYFVGYNGSTYTNCRIGDDPTKLLVMFDDHHMPIGELKMQIAYHTTIEEFPDRKFDEVTNPTNVTVDIDETEYQVMLDFTGESGAEIDFSMPSSGVMSVNGKIGYVTLNAEDVGAQPTIEDLATIRSGAAEGATAVQPDEMTAALATKQDTISDLSEIRRGAALGSTAVRPSELQQGLSTKQDTISDLATIRSGAAAGATAVQPAELQEGLAEKQDTISDLSTIRNGAAAGATAVQPAGLTPIQTALQTIEAVIPSAASSQNQLADKNFVNSSISTNNANFVGTYNSLAELQAVQNPTNNDYGFVIETDAQGNEYYDRYKYVASSQQWLFEYKVESTPFTAAQWAAIQSGITSALVTKLNALPTNAELQQTLDGKADAADIPTALSQLSQDSTHRTVTDAEKSTWNGKQNAISDLATIRSGAAAGATAVQPAAMNAALATKQDTLTFDNTPTANSNNPVKSGGIKTALDAKQSTISTVNVTVDNNTGTPSGSASVSGSTLSLSFQNLKGATGATGATGPQGPQGPQGERGLPGESGVTGDVSGFTVIQTIDPSATYGATDIAGAATVQATNAELTELSGNMSSLVTYEDLDFSSISTIAYFTGDTTWTSYSNYTSKIIPLSNGVSFIRVTAGSYDTYLYLLNNGTAPTNTGQTPSFANGETHRRTIAAGTTVVITLPNDCTYIAIGVWAGKNVQPSRIEEGVNNTIVDAIEYIQETTKDAVYLANQLVKSTTILESSITWTSGKGLVADPYNAGYGNLTTSSVVKTSDYVGLPKGIITFTLPTYQSSTSFGVIFYDVNKQAQHSIVLPVTGSYGYQDYTFENTDYSYGRFVWFQSSSYGNFSITIKYADILDEQDVKEITENVIINGSEQTITEWTSGKGLVATTTNLGSLNNSSVLSVSGYIDVSNAKSIGLKLVSYESSTTFGFVWYNSSKVAINGTTFEVGGTFEMYDAIIDVPDNAAFLRTCKLQTYTSDFVVSKFIIKDGNSYDKILIAASDSTDFDKARAQYVCTGTNDEAMINRAVSALSPYQDLHFAKGTYYIDSFFASTDGEEDYVICSPVGTQNRHRLVCDDAMPCKTSSSATDLGTFANSAKFVITSSCYEALDANKQYSIIRCNSYNGSRRYGANAIQVEGLSFIIPDNQKKIICIDAKWAAFIQVKNVMASAVANVSSLKVPVEGCIGIRGTMGSNFGTGNWIEHCFVWGFYEGYAIAGEHLVCSDIGSRFCNYGFTFNNFENLTGAWTHPITMINCTDECNFNMPLFGHNGEHEQTDNQGGRQSITFINFNFEWLSSYSQYGGEHAKELTPGEWYGEIYYVIQTSTGGNAKNETNIAFWADDGSGKNIKSVNQAQLQQTTKNILKTYAPNYNQIVFLTDINMPVVCVNPNTKEWRDFAGNVITL